MPELVYTRAGFLSRTSSPDGIRAEINQLVPEPKGRAQCSVSFRDREGLCCLDLYVRVVGVTSFAGTKYRYRPDPDAHLVELYKAEVPTVLPLRLELVRVSPSDWRALIDGEGFSGVDYPVFPDAHPWFTASTTDASPELSFLFREVEEFRRGAWAPPHEFNYEKSVDGRFEVSGDVNNFLVRPRSWMEGLET